MQVAGLITTPEATITSLLAQRLAEEPEAEWCRLVDAQGQIETITVRRLLERAMAFAARLGPPTPTRKDVAVCLYHGLDLHAAFLGALWAGHIPTMLAPPSPRMEAVKYARNFCHTIECVRPAVVILEPAVHARLDPAMLVPFQGVELLDPTAVPPATTVPSWPARPDDTAFIQHSSGTTGLQKGIAIQHGAVLRHHRHYAERLAMTPDDVIVSWLPLYHDMGFIACFLLPLLGRMRLVQLSPFDWVLRPHLLLEHIHRHRGTLCWLPNFAYSFMAQSIRPGQLAPELRLDTIRAWVNCSEPVYANSHAEFLTAFAPWGARADQFTACYGMAENVFAVTQTKPGAGRTIHVDRGLLATEHRAVLTGRLEDKSLVSNGPPVAGTEVAVLDDTDEPLPDGQVGQLVLRGVTLFSGYHRRADLTHAAFTAAGWYRTGDLGFLHEGEVFVTGRRKDLIIIQGRNFYPGDLEATAGRVPGIAAGRVVAFGLSDEVAGTEKLVILAEAEPDSAEHPKQLALKIRNAVAQELDCTLGLVQIVPTRWLVKSTSGKLARNDNRQKFLATKF